MVSGEIGCVLASHLRARLELRRRPELADQAALIVERAGSRVLVVDHLPAASPLVLGRSLKAARSIEPDALVLEADEPYYRQAFEQLLGALEQVSDRVEAAELGIAYVGVDGLAAMHGGEAALFARLLSAAPEHLPTRIGVGPNKFTAYIAARTQRAAGVLKIDGDPAAFLAPKPIDWLPVSPNLQDDLRRLGLETMGAVAAQDAHALLDRFGREGRRAWELCQAIDERPLRPRTPVELVTERLALPTESTTLPLLRAALETVLQRAYAQPRMLGREAGAARLTCSLEAGSSWERAYHFQRPLSDWRPAAEIIKARLEHDHPQAPVEALTMMLTNLSGASGEQGRLFPDQRDQRRDRERRLLETERRLQARLNGKQALRRLVEAAPGHPVPELRTMQVSIDPAADDGLQPLSAPAEIAVREGPEREPRAVRIGGRWRGVVRIEDQWSFDLWWRPTPIQRRYYRVSQADGGQLVLFREPYEDRWYRQHGASA